MKAAPLALFQEANKQKDKGSTGSNFTAVDFPILRSGNGKIAFERPGEGLGGEIARFFSDILNFIVRCFQQPGS